VPIQNQAALGVGVIWCGNIFTLALYFTGTDFGPAQFWTGTILDRRNFGPAQFWTKSFWTGVNLRERSGAFNGFCAVFCIKNF